MANPITNLDPVLPPFRDGIQDQNDKLNAMYEFFEQGPFNAVPTSGGTMTGPLHLQVALEVASGGTGAQNAADARTNLGAAAATDLAALGAATGTALAGKEPTIPTGTLTQYVAGDKTLRTFFADVRAATMAAVSFVTSTAVVATDTLLVAIGKLQAQNTITVNRIGDAGGFTFRNRIINGSCLVVQRTATAISSYGGPDRYFSLNANATGATITQGAGSLVYGGQTKATVRHTVTVAATSIASSSILGGLMQNIEGINCYDLKQKPVVVSFIFNTTVSGNYSISLRDGSSTYSYVSSFTAVANTPIKITVKISASPAGLAVAANTNNGLSLNIGALNTATYQTATANAWTNTNTLTLAGAVNWAATLNAFIELTELQLESGTVATEFEVLPYSVIFAQCQRYYWVCRKFFGICAGATSMWRAGVPHPVRMRANPTLTLSSSMQIQAGTATSYLSAIGTNYSTDMAIEFDGVIDSQGSAAGSLITGIAAAGNYIGVSAEL